MALAQPKVWNLASLIRPVLIQLEVKRQRIAAGDRADLAHPVGVLDHPDVARVEKVVFDFVRVFPHGSLRVRLSLCGIIITLSGFHRSLG